MRLVPLTEESEIGGFINHKFLYRKGRGRLRLEIAPPPPPPLKVLGDDLPPSIPTR